jgi:UTP--glucose-1-phosphate uridylyltransferase
MVKKAVIPAAGLGTRFLPATKASPKEMLPVVDTPTIQYVVQEAVDSGIEDILIISGKGKRSIEDHFDRHPELEERLLEKEDKMYDEIMHLSDMAHIHFIRQKEINGLGDAIMYARHHTGNQPFAVLLGDTIINSAIPVTQQLIDIYEQYQSSVIAVETVPHDKVSRYGIVGGTMLSSTLMELNTLIENTPPGKNNEVQLTDALVKLLKSECMYAHTIEGKRYDIGNKLDFLKTNVEFALQRKEFAKPFYNYLKEIVETYKDQFK